MRLRDVVGVVEGDPPPAGMGEPDVLGRRAARMVGVDDPDAATEGCEDLRRFVGRAVVDDDDLDVGDVLPEHALDALAEIRAEIVGRDDNRTDGYDAIWPVVSAPFGVAYGLATAGHLAMAWENATSRVPAAVISGFVSDVLAPHTPSVAGSTVDRLLAIVLGSGRTRFAPRPGAEGAALVRQRIAAAVAREEPVSFLTMWGAIKHYVRDEDQGVDLAELFAVLRLVQLVRDVAEVHPPGAVVHVIVEDFGVWYEDAYRFPASVQSSIAAGSRAYTRELIRLCDVVGGPATEDAHVRRDRRSRPAEMSGARGGQPRAA